MKTIKSHGVVHQKCLDPKVFMLWHDDHLGQLGPIIMHQIIENLYGHFLKNQKIILPSKYPCVARSKGKLIIRPFPSKLIIESPFSLRIHGDICEHIHLQCLPCIYFMILIDVLTR